MYRKQTNLGARPQKENDMFNSDPDFKAESVINYLKSHIDTLEIIAGKDQVAIGDRSPDYFKGKRDALKALLNDINSEIVES